MCMLGKVVGPVARQSVVAWRFWNKEMRSLSFGFTGSGATPWEIGEERIAKCLSYDKACLPGGVPGPNCNCGFWAYKSLGHLLCGTSSIYGANFGKVLFTGRILEHQFGYRAERAKILEVVPVEETAILSESNYGPDPAPALAILSYMRRLRGQII